MSAHGRCQDALYDLFKYCDGRNDVPGPVMQAGVTWDQWKVLIEPIIEAIFDIAYDFGRRVEREHPAG